MNRRIKLLLIVFMAIYVVVGSIAITYTNFKTLELENQSLKETIKDKEELIEVSKGLLELRDDVYAELYTKYQQELGN